MGRQCLGTCARRGVLTATHGHLGRNCIQAGFLWVLGRGRREHRCLDFGFHHPRDVRRGDRRGPSRNSLDLKHFKTGSHLDGASRLELFPTQRDCDLFFAAIENYLAIFDSLNRDLVDLGA